MTSPTVRSLIAAALAAGAVAAQERTEIRGVWIPNTDTAFFDSRADVAAGMQALADGGVNVVFPVVWSKGYTLFESDTLGSVLGVRIDPRYAGRDPLAEVIVEAHRYGIEVIPWFEYGFCAGHESLGAPVLRARPDWAAIGHDGEPVVKNGFPWMDPFHPEVKAFVTGLVLEVARGYDVDGVQGDDRLPAMPCEAGYDARTVAAWRAEHGTAPPDDPRDPAWTRWRADLLTDYLAELRAAVETIDPDLVFSMAPGAPGWAYREYLQDQETWMERGLVDALHPQVYARDFPGYERILDDVLGIAWIASQRDKLIPGVLVRVGGWRSSPELLLEVVAENRRRELPGEVHFHHQGLLDRDGALLDALARGPYAAAARLPWRGGADWRPRATMIDPHPVSGPWDREERALTLPSEAAGVASWTLTPETSGTFGVYFRVPGPRDPPPSYALRLSGSDERIDAPAREELVRIGTVNLTAGQRTEIARLDAAEGIVTVGPMMLLVDRRARRQ